MKVHVKEIYLDTDTLDTRVYGRHKTLIKQIKTLTLRHSHGLIDEFTLNNKHIYNNRRNNVKLILVQHSQRH